MIAVFFQILRLPRRYSPGLDLRRSEHHRRMIWDRRQVDNFDRDLTRSIWKLTSMIETRVPAGDRQ